MTNITMKNVALERNFSGKVLQFFIFNLLKYSSRINSRFLSQAFCPPKRSNMRENIKGILENLPLCEILDQIGWLSCFRKMSKQPKPPRVGTQRKFSHADCRKKVCLICFESKTYKLRDLSENSNFIAHLKEKILIFRTKENQLVFVKLVERNILVMLQLRQK